MKRPAGPFEGQAGRGRRIKLFPYDQKLIFKPYWIWRQPFSRDAVASPKLWFGVIVVLTMLRAHHC